MALTNDGFSTSIAFADDTSVQMEVISLTPPAFEGGGEIDTTTMSNTTYTTKALKQLINIGPVSLTVAYDSALYDEVLAMMQSNQQITITLPDTTTIIFWGGIDSFTPGELVIGERPTAEMSIIVTNRNDSNVETGPVYSA